MAPSSRLANSVMSNSSTSLRWLPKLARSPASGRKFCTTQSMCRSDLRTVSSGPSILGSISSVAPGTEMTPTTCAASTPDRVPFEDRVRHLEALGSAFGDSTEPLRQSIIKCELSVFPDLLLDETHA